MSHLRRTKIGICEKIEKRESHSNAEIVLDGLSFCMDTGKTGFSFPESGGRPAVGEDFLCHWLNINLKDWWNKNGKESDSS